MQNATLFVQQEFQKSPPKKYRGSDNVTLMVHFIFHLVLALYSERHFICAARNPGLTKYTMVIYL